MIPLVVGWALSVPAAGAPGLCDHRQSIVDRPQGVPSVRGVLWEHSAPDHLPESVAGAAVFDPTPRVGSVLAQMMSNSNVIRWSMKGGASIPHCTSGTIFRSG